MTRPTVDDEAITEAIDVAPLTPTVCNLSRMGVLSFSSSLNK